jgi:DNA-binding response OmpR family regulator
MHILLVDDEPMQSALVEMVLERFNFEISTVDNGEKAVSFLERSPPPDLVILDWHLPKMSGLEVLHWIRTQLGSRIAVLFLTSNVLEADIVFALNAGADEYVVKPFRPAELAARVTALLRRTTISAQHHSVLHIGVYTLDLKLRTVLLHDKDINLTEREFQLVMLLFTNIGRLLSRDFLVKTAWSREFECASRTLDTHIYRIRQKLLLRPENGMRLSSIYMRGYRLDSFDEKIVTIEAEQVRADA